MPLGNLLPRTVDHLVPLTSARRVRLIRPIAHLQAPDHLVAGDAIPVIDDELDADAAEVCAAAGAGDRGTALCGTGVVSVCTGVLNDLWCVYTGV